MYRLWLLLVFVFILLFAAPWVTAGETDIKAGLSRQKDNGVKEITEEGSEKVYYLEEIVTTATRIPHILKYTPVSVSVLTRDRIEAANPQDVGDILEEVAGLKVERYGAMGANSTVHLRGLYSSHVLVMVDGRPVNSPSLGSADLSWLSVDNIERVEVVRGPSSALYGANAVAGVINIITRQYSAQPSVGAQLGSFNQQSAWAQSSFNLGQWKSHLALQYLASGNDKNQIIDRDLQSFFDEILGSQS